MTVPTMPTAQNSGRIRAARRDRRRRGRRANRRTAARPSTVNVFETPMLRRDQHQRREQDQAFAVIVDAALRARLPADGGPRLSRLPAIVHRGLAPACPPSPGSARARTTAPTLSASIVSSIDIHVLRVFPICLKARS